MKESQLSTLPFKTLLLNTTRRNYKKDLEDSLVVLPSLRSVEPPKLRSVNLKTELKMLSAPPELLPMKVLCQVEVLLSFMPQKHLTRLRELTSTKILELRLLEKHAKSHAKLFAKIQVSKVQLLLTNSSKLELSHMVSMLLSVSTVI